MKQFTYDYYRVYVPDDITEADERARIAFLEAENMARLWVSPCEWKILSDDSNTIIVRRKRYIR